MTVRPEEPEHPEHPEPAKPLPAAPLPRLKLPGVSGPSEDDTAHDEAGKSRRRGRTDPGLRAKDRRGGAARDQRKFVPRRGGG